MHYSKGPKSTGWPSGGGDLSIAKAGHRIVYEAEMGGPYRKTFLNISIGTEDRKDLLQYLLGLNSEGEFLDDLSEAIRYHSIFKGVKARKRKEEKHVPQEKKNVQA